VSTMVNGETSKRLGQSAKRSATVRGQAGMGATWQADVCRVRQSGKSRFSACQVLWKIRFRGRSAALLPLRARPIYD
jgi:hypothetical protein